MAKPKVGQTEKQHVCQKCLGAPSFKTSQSLVGHNRRIHEARRPYSCSFCVTTFYASTELAIHVRREHTGEKPYACTQCPKSFVSQGILQGHILYHLKLKPHACTHCDKTFVNSYDLTQHLRVHSGEKPFPCDECGKHFRQKSSLRTHLRIHTGERPYSCKYCSSKYSRKEHIENHLRSHTGEQPYRCDQCSRSFSTRNSMEHHIKSLHSGPRPRLKCPDCNKEYSYKTALQRHIRDHHPSQDQQVSCRKCGEHFKTYAMLRQHYREHHSKRFDCAFCERSYASKSGVTDHMLAHHTGEKSFSCRARGCGRAFISLTSLSTHTKTHQTDWVRGRPFECKWCQRAYYERGHLRKHVARCKQTPEFKKEATEVVARNAETGRYKFLCNTCAKPCSTKWRLTEHMRIHDPERKKSVVCVHCGKKAFNSSCLARHVATSAKCIEHRRRMSESCHVGNSHQSIRELRVVLSPIKTTLLKFMSNKLRM